MKYLSWSLLIGFCLLLNACSESISPEECQGCPEYQDLTQPEHVLQQTVVAAYIRRDADKYSELLSDDFVFKFVPGSPEEIQEPNGLDRKADSTQSANMFRSPSVIDIRLVMTWKNPMETTWLGTTEVLRMDLDRLRLVVETNINDTTYLVEGGLNSFYVTSGRPDRGEDPDRYYLVGWEDFGGLGGEPGGVGLASSETTWGSNQVAVQASLDRYPPAGRVVLTGSPPVVKLRC